MTDLNNTNQVNNTNQEDNKNQVFIYSTPTCMYCNMLKTYLEQNGVEFTDYNVQEDIEKAREMVEMTGQMGVPVVKIGDEIIIGFDQPRIAELLGLE